MHPLFFNRKDNTHFYITSDLKLEQAYEGRLLIFTFENGSRQAIEGWYKILEQLSRDYDPQDPLYVVYDLSTLDYIPLWRNWARRGAAISKKLSHTHVAVVLPQGILGRMIDVFIRGEIGRFSGHHFRGFRGLQDALQWVDDEYEKDFPPMPDAPLEEALAIEIENPLWVSP